MTAQIQTTINLSDVLTGSGTQDIVYTAPSAPNLTSQASVIFKNKLGTDVTLKIYLNDPGEPFVQATLAADTGFATFDVELAPDSIVYAESSDAVAIQWFVSVRSLESV